MADEPKSLAAMLVAGHSASPMDPSNDPSADPNGQDPQAAGEEAAASEMIDALKTGDTQSFAAALKNFLAITGP